MPINLFLNQLTLLLKTGIATEQSYRFALGELFKHILHVEAINEPKHEIYGAPDFVLMRNATIMGHVEAKDIGVKLNHAIHDSLLEKPKTPNGKQLKRYREALPNLLYTDGLVWYWFVHGEQQQQDPVLLATWDGQTLVPTLTGEKDLSDLLNQYATKDLETLSQPDELARRLAQIAHWLRELLTIQVKEQKELGPLQQQFMAFQKTLLPNLSEDEFADMYAQTIVYGLFAARIAQPEKQPFRRQDAAFDIPNTNPFLQTLFYQVAGPALDPKIAWLINNCAELLSHTNMAEVLKNFGKATQKQDPVIHFYETFLTAYDPKLREIRGVYYTPEPVVHFIVRSIHSVLQTHFDKPLGLADEETIILDPATGTATFLHAIVQHIYAELQEQGLGGIWEQYVPEKLLNRLFGFELLMAPYTIAHLKLGLLLKELGYTFQGQQRLGIYLTNSLADAPLQQTFAFAQTIAEEGSAAHLIKQQRNVMVVLGNPPYSGNSANNNLWIKDLLRGKIDNSRTENYYEVDGQPLHERNPKWLQDDYVKFIRFGEWRIARSGAGVLSYISNNGYLDNLTFRGMRQSLLHDFDLIYILNLHGNSKKRERSPDGSIDENVFNIQQGVAIAIFIKTPQRTKKTATVFYADLFGKKAAKYKMLNENDLHSIPWQQLEPSAPWYLFIPQNKLFSTEYEQHIKLQNLFPLHSVGIVTARDSLTIQYTVKEMAALIQDFSTLSCEKAREKYQLGADTRDWKVDLAQKDIQNNGTDATFIQKIHYRPFDNRYTYYSGQTRGFICMPRFDVMKHSLRHPNLLIRVVRQQIIDQQWAFAFVGDCISESSSISFKSPDYVFPLYLYPSPTATTNGFEYHEADNERQANIAPEVAREWAERLGLAWQGDGQGDLTTTIGPEDIFHYTYAILYCPSYRERYAEQLKIDFPRVPPTNNLELFKALVLFGSQLVDLHLLRLPGTYEVGGNGGSSLLQKPGKAGLSFPQSGNCQVEQWRYRPPTEAEQGAVFINETQYFLGVPEETWNMRIGGYQPLEKWLKDRKGRTLNTDEISHYLRMVIALRETREIMEKIDQTIPSWPLE